MRRMGAFHGGCATCTARPHAEFGRAAKKQRTASVLIDHFQVAACLCPTRDTGTLARDQACCCWRYTRSVCITPLLIGCIALERVQRSFRYPGRPVQRNPAVARLLEK